MIAARACALAILSGVYLLSLALPAGGAVYNAALCPLRFLTGIPCPMCGMTRGFIDISHGNIREALKVNPASPVLYLLGIAILTALAADLFAAGRPFSRYSGVWIAAAAVAASAVLAAWVAGIASCFS
jgi:hypothetical protein